jgi:hypothetical protein
MLISMVYVSAATRPLSPTELAEIVDGSRRNNIRDGITGLLLYHDGNFMQALEGPEAEVRALIERIKRDPRHTGMILMVRQYIAERSFPDWAMECRNSDLIPVKDRKVISHFLEEVRRPSIAYGMSDVAIWLLLSFRDSMMSP